MWREINEEWNISLYVFVSQICPEGLDLAIQYIYIYTMQIHKKQKPGEDSYSGLGVIFP